MYFVGINAGAQVAIILLTCGPCVVIVNCYDRFCIFGRAPLTKKILPNFHEWCRVTRPFTIIPQVDGLSTNPRDLGRHKIISLIDFFLIF